MTSKLLIAAILILQTPMMALAQFDCHMIADSGAVLKLLPDSPEETYMLSGQYKDLEISTYQNEDSKSYQVSISNPQGLIVSTTVAIYPDTNLTLRYQNETLIVRCQP